MKAFRLLATSLLVALSMGVSSCGGDELDREPISIPTEPSILEKMDKAFAEYIGDYSNITCRYYQEGESSILFAGLKNQRLWFAEYEKTEAKGIKLEWTDIEKTDTIQLLYKGYGEYETLYVKHVIPLVHKETSTGNIVTFNIGGRFQTIFTSNHKTKRTQLQYDNTKNGIARSWYKESVFIADCCYSHEGDTIYTTKSKPSFDENGNPADISLLSYEEGIKLSDSFISKYNFKEGKSMWGTNIVAPFDVPSDAKRSYTLLDSTTNIWKYKCEVTFYDGTKKDFTFKINIDNGKIINNVTGITLNETSKELDIIDTFQLIAIIEPANATNTNIIWSSSNEEVATVNQKGLVTAKSIGEAVITATTEDGNFKATATIKVLSPKYITQVKSDNGNYSYNMSLIYANGKLSNYIWKYNNGDYEFNQKIDYSGKKVIMSGIVDGEDCVQTYTLNSEGYATSCSIPDYEGKAIEISFEYSEEGYLIKAIEIIKLPNETRSNTYSFTYSKDGDIIQGNESDISGAGSLYTQTYSSRINKSGIMDYAMSQLLFNYQTAFYCGLLGKSCKHLPSSCKETEIHENGWWSKTYEFIHEQDSNSYVTKTVISDSDGDSEVLTYTYDK